MASTLEREAQRKRPFSGCPISRCLCCWLGAVGLLAGQLGASSLAPDRWAGPTTVRLHGCPFQRHSCLYSLPILASVFPTQSGLFVFLESVEGERGGGLCVHSALTQASLEAFDVGALALMRMLFMFEKGKFHDLINTDGSLKGLNYL